MRAFEIHPPKQPVPKPVAKTPRRWRRWGLAGLFLLLLGAGWWAVRPDPELARARQLQQELFAERPPGPPTEDRKAKFKEFRDTMAKLSDGQKRELFEPMRQKSREEFDRYFTLGKQEKVQYLDRLIDRSEKMRKDIEQKQKAGGQPGGRGFGAPGGFGPPGGKAKGPPDPDRIEERKKQRLDKSTPEERAKRDQFRHDMDARRKQRGLPAGGGRGFGPGR
jgi:hypothetical protein